MLATLPACIPSWRCLKTFSAHIARWPCLVMLPVGITCKCYLQALPVDIAFKPCFLTLHLTKLCAVCWWTVGDVQPSGPVSTRRLSNTVPADHVMVCRQTLHQLLPDSAAINIRVSARRQRSVTDSDSSVIASLSQSLSRRQSKIVGVTVAVLQ